MRHDSERSRCSLLLGIAAALSLSTVAAHGQVGKIEVANPGMHGDGTMSSTAAAAMGRGTLFLEADIIRKRAVTRAARQSGAWSRRLAPSDLGPVGGHSRSPRSAPIIVGGQRFAGQTDTTGTPPDTTGAIGPTRFIQLVNRRFGIYNRSTGALINSGTLNTLAGLASSVNSFDPQVIWDPTTKRFYYVMDSIFSSSNNKLAFGFSRTASPNNGTTDWCHYTYTPNDPARFPDYPKLGDSRFFIIIGVNSFKASFVGSDLIAIGKPPPGNTCPMEIPKAGSVLNLRDSNNAQVFTPVPANQIDHLGAGFVVARNGGLPSNKLWFFTVRRASTGFPVFGKARGVTVPSYTVPPNANQPTNGSFGYGPLLDTLDARPTQAVQAYNPDRKTYSFWTQHTIQNGSFAAVRWYEINPIPATPVVLRTGKVASGSAHLFNAAISPDRQVNGPTRRFGNSFVVEYNVSSSSIDPRILAGSSFSGGGLSFLLVRNGVDTYRDFSCPSSSDTLCRWGDYSGATPDPNPPSNRPRTDRGAVWGTNQYSGVANPPANGTNWRTWIFNVQP